MIRLLGIFLIFLTGCNTKKPQLNAIDTNLTRTNEYQDEIVELLKVDKQNKLLEEEYLREIAIAQTNNDRDAYKFFIVEYIKVPRIPIPEWVKKEPGFYPRKTAAQVIREVHGESQ